MKHFVQNLTFQKKIILYGCVLVIPILWVVCFLLTTHNYLTEKEVQNANHRTQVTLLAENFDMLQREIQQISTYLYINDDIYALLTSTPSPEIPAHTHLWYNSAPMEFVLDMVSFHNHIKSLAFYSMNGISPFLRGMDGSVYLPNTQEILETQAYQDTLARANGMMWSASPQGKNGVYLANISDKLMFYRAFYTRSRDNVIGFLAMGVDITGFRNICENALTHPGEGVLVVNSGGSPLISMGELPEQVVEYLSDVQFLEHVPQGETLSKNLENYQVIYRKEGKNSAVFCKILPTGLSLAEFLEFSKVPLILTSLIFCAQLLLLLIISNLVTRPLKKVHFAISNLAKGDFSQQSQLETKDEIAEIARCFNQMVNNIKELIDENYVVKLREKESELAVLQAHLNPHFLYNTLDCLYWQTLNQGNEETAHSILALSQLFRLVLSDGRREITVGQEVELVSRYLQIQKMRFQSNLNYTLDVSEEILPIPITKLILQPFVENALVHGFQNKEEPCFLRVTGRFHPEEGRVSFLIEDSGVGISPERLAQLKEPSEKVGMGYAIRNIRQRLALKYQENFTLTIQSTLGKGSSVFLAFPVEEEEISWQSPC